MSRKLRPFLSKPGPIGFPASCGEVVNLKFEAMPGRVALLAYTLDEAGENAETFVGEMTIMQALAMLNALADAIVLSESISGWDADVLRTPTKLLK